MSTSTNSSPKRTWEPKRNDEYFHAITRALANLQAFDGTQVGWLADEPKNLKKRIRTAMTDPKLDIASISIDAVAALKDIYRIVKGSSNDADWERHAPEKVNEIKDQLKELANLVGKLEQAVKP